MSKVPELRFDGFVGEWEEVQLGTEADVRDGTHDSPKYVNKGYPLITSKNIVNGKLNFNDISFISEEDFFLINKRSKVDIGDIIMPMIGTIGNPTILNRDDFAIKNVALIKKSNNLNNQFLLNLLNSKVFSRYLYIENAGGTQKFIALGMIREFLFNRPNIEEQEKIGNLFRKIDDLIEIQEGKVAKMRDYKKSMLQKMFPKKDEHVPKFRFDGFDGEWKTVKFKEFLKEYNEKTKNEDELVMLSSTNSGMTYRERNVSVTTNVGYKIIYKNDLVLSPQNLWLGNINFNNLEDGIVSPSYLTFKIDGLDSNFIEPQLRTKRMLENYKNASSQGASVVRRNLEKNEFYGIKLLNPSLEEQQKIGNFFKNIDTQIENEERLLDSYKMMKKSLLQKMFV